jgi:acyl-CoA synthetase (AMP-forming)/AMP-acid ligase II
MELHFACAAIHAVVVNLNIHLAPRELAFICADSAPKLVFADTACAPTLLAAHAELVQQRAAAANSGAEAMVPPVFAKAVWMLVEGGAQLPAAVHGLEVSTPAVGIWGGLESAGAALHSATAVLQPAL